MGRPIILFERIPLAAAPVPPGTPSPTVRADPTILSPPEAMRVDYLAMDTEIAGQAPGIRVRPMLVEREFWPTVPTEVSLYNNLSRSLWGEDFGEFWLEEPYLLRRDATINIRIRNRMIGLAGEGIVMFQGRGITSKRPYDLPIHWTIGAGSEAGVEQVFGGGVAHVSGREDVLIHALTWQRGIESEGWNPRRIHLSVEPSYGQQWMSKGGTARGAGGLHCPLVFLSNIRGPLVAAFYKPAEDIFLEQGDEISFEFNNMNQGVPSTALLAIIGTSKAK